MIARDETDPIRILLLEDDPAMRDLLAVVLENEGYQVVEDTSTSPRIRRMVRGEPKDGDPAFDLILSDIRMPGNTGLDIVAGLRAYDFLQPVVLITGFGSQEVHEEARRLGAAILDKPFDMPELLDVVRELCPLEPPPPPRLAAAG